jgi:hypothetical protein
MDSKDPRRTMPVMYRRQKEMDDGSVFFYSDRPVSNLPPSKKIRQLKRRQQMTRLGRWLLIANFVLLLIVLVVFNIIKGSPTDDGALNISMVARYLEPQIIVNARLTLGEQTADLAGQLVGIWLWLWEDDKVYRPGDPIPPEAVYYLDVLPLQSGEALLVRERFGAGDFIDWRGVRIWLLADYETGRAVSHTRVGQE